MKQQMATPSFAKASEGKQKKIDTVTTLTDKIAKSKSFIFTEYRGLKHKQLEELRKLVKKEEGEFVVTKNKLLERALGTVAAQTKEVLTDATATLFSYRDEIAPLRVMLKFFKTAGLGKPKGGVVGTAVFSEKDIARLADLPTRDVLLGRLVRQLNAPIQGLHYALSWNINKFVWALNAIKSKKSN